MRLERLTYNKIKIFLTLDDLSERGLCKEDIWKDSLKWHQLFDDMLREATDEFGVEINGPVAVEIFSLQAQGMIMIVTVEEQNEDEEYLSDGIIEMEVTVEDNEEILFVFENIEDVIQLSKRLIGMDFYDGSLYVFENNYYLVLHQISLPEDEQKIVALLAEYGNPSLLSIHRLMEYGKLIIEEKAIKTLVEFFH